MIRWGEKLTREGFLHNPDYAHVFDGVDRPDFVPEEYGKSSDSDEPIPIHFGQTQSAPHMDAILVSQGEPERDDKVLEIGTGSGYLTTILSLLSGWVMSIERIPELAEWAGENISKYNRTNIDLVIGNVNSICINQKFDLVVSTASYSREPNFLSDLVKPGGKLIFPLGRYPPQRLIKYKNGKREEICSVAFVSIVD